MEGSNDWNSSFWIDELAKLAEDNSTKSPSPTLNSGSNRDSYNGPKHEVDSKFAELVDLSEPYYQDKKYSIADSNSTRTRHSSTKTIQLDNTSRASVEESKMVEIDGSNGGWQSPTSGNRNSSHGSEMVTLNFANILTQMQDEQREQKINNRRSTVDNAVNYHNKHDLDLKFEQTKISFSQLMGSGAPPPAVEKKNYNTEQVFCTLHDLLLGVKSPTIRLAVNKMKEDGKQLAAKKGTSPISPLSPTTPISFKLLVQEQQQTKAKMYNTNAKEFKPMFTKWTY